MKTLLCLALSSALAFGQGTLTPPPGPPAPTMKTLDQLEPRIAVNATNTPGDATNSFIISAPGSYYLTGNITGVSFRNGIAITASGVTLDLMGFEIRGVGGSLAGVISNSAFVGIAVRNGTVRNWGGTGVKLSFDRGCQYQDLRLSDNGLHGLESGQECTVVNCTAHSNGGDGFKATSGTTISGCSAGFNGGRGIYGGAAGTVSGCAGYGNGGTGIEVTEGSTVNGCTVRFNSPGISAGTYATVTGCTAQSNTHGIVAVSASTISGCTATFNFNDGILVSDNCRVVENTCAGNGVANGDGAGINATSSRNRIDSNTVMGNDRGIDCNPGTANLIIRNSARGNTVNYDIAAGNNSAAIILNPGVGFTSTNPWANFEF